MLTSINEVVKSFEVILIWTRHSFTASITICYFFRVGILYILHLTIVTDLTYPTYSMYIAYRQVCTEKKKQS